MSANSGYRPWFIQRSEVEERIVTTKADSEKRNLQTLLDEQIS